MFSNIMYFILVNVMEPFQKNAPDSDVDPRDVYVGNLVKNVLQLFGSCVTIVYLVVVRCRPS